MLVLVPQSGQSLASTQSPILTNFTTIDTAFTVNHVPYSDPSGNQGMHNFIQFPVVSPAPTTSASQVGLYAQTSSLTSQPELVFSHEAGSSAPVPAQVVEFTSAGWSTPGWARLPSGILLKWGHASMPTGPSGAGNPPVVYPVSAAIPVFNTVYQVILSQVYTANQNGLGSSGFGIYTSTTTQFTVTWNGSNASGAIVSYLAIGI